MSNYRLILSILSIVLSFNICSLQAQEYVEEPTCVGVCDEDAVHYGLELAYHGKYVQAGRVLYHHQPVFQPAAWASYRNFTATVWSDLNWKHRFRHQNPSLNYGLDYANCYKDYRYAVGFSHFRFPEKRERTIEAHASLGLNSVLNPTLTGYIGHSHTRQCVKHSSFGNYSDHSVYCFGRERSWWATTLSVEHNFGSLYAGAYPFNVIVDANISYRSRNYNTLFYNTNKAAITDANIKASFPIQLTDNWTCTPYIGATALVSKHIRDHFHHQKDTLLYGVSLSAAW